MLINLKSKKATYFLFSLPALLLYTYFYVFSVYRGVIYSLTDWNGISKTYNFIGFENYSTLFESRRFIDALFRTAKYAIIFVIIVIILSFVVALCLDSLRKLKGFMRSIFFFPAMISSVAVTLTWDQLFYRAVPYVGELLNINILKINPLASPKTAIYAVMFVHMWQALAMPTIIFLAGLQSIPQELVESAKIDGSNRYHIFKHIILPFMVPTLTVNIVLQLKGAITMFDYAYALVQGGPARSTELVSLLIMNDAFSNMRFSLANAQAFVLFVIIAILSTLQIKLTEHQGVYSS